MKCKQSEYSWLKNWGERGEMKDERWWRWWEMSEERKEMKNKKELMIDDDNESRDMHDCGKG